MTVPTGVVSTDNILIVLTTATSTAAGHSLTSSTGTGTLSVPTGGMNGTTIGTSWKVTTLIGTGHVAGDVLTFACPASGITTGIGGAWDNAYTFDVCGSIGTTGGTTVTVSSLTTGAANCLVLCVAVGGQTSTRSVSSLTPGTAELALNGAGGNTRWTAISVSDQIITSAGASGSVAVTFSGALSGSTGIQISLKPAGGGSTVRNARVAGTATPISSRKARVAGVATTATRRVRVGGVAV